MLGIQERLIWEEVGVVVRLVGVVGARVSGVIVMLAVVTVTEVEVV